MKKLRINGKVLGKKNQPLICTPVVGKTRGDVMEELATIIPKRPDLLEWRVDFFEGFGDIAAVIGLASEMKSMAGDIPVIFACRSLNEGGGSNALNESDVLKLYVAACASRCIDIIDYEMSNAAANVAMLREVSRDNGVLMIMSYHNHQFTPDGAELTEKFIDAERLGGDVAKIVVMPRSSKDVLTLLGATLKASRTVRIPLVGMSMGETGSISRIAGWFFGSSITFAIGKHGSVPGQMTIEELRPVLASVRHAALGLC